MWDLETNMVLNEIKTKNARKVLLQAPEGLKRAVEKEIEFLKTKVDAELMIWGETCFGACDLCDEDRITSYNVCYTKLLRYKNMPS